MILLSRMTEYSFVTTRDGEGECTHRLAHDEENLVDEKYFALTRDFRAFWFGVRLRHTRIMDSENATIVQTVLSGDGLR